MHRSDPSEAPVIPGYAVVRELGRGGMGVVYLATQVSLGRSVAIKVLLPEVLDDGLAVRRLQKEGRTMRELSHPNVVRLLDLDMTCSTPYLVFEYVPQEASIEGLLESGGRSVAETVPILRGIADALAYLHSRSIVHRDLKPGNILLGAGDEPRLIDFGLSRSVSADDTRQTQAGHVVGTLAYMAPEQMEGRDATPASDVYAWGLTAYEFLCGRFVFSSRAGSTQISPTYRYVKPVPPVMDRSPKVPPGLGNLVMACLDRTSAKRPLAADVVTYLDAGDWQSVGGTRWTREVGTPGRVWGGGGRSSKCVSDPTLPTGGVPAPDGTRPTAVSGGLFADRALARFAGAFGLLVVLAAGGRCVLRIGAPVPGPGLADAVSATAGPESSMEPVRASALVRDLEALADQTGHIDRAWLQRRIATLPGLAGHGPLDADRQRIVTAAAIQAAGIGDVLARVLDASRAQGPPSSDPAERLAWANLAGLELLEHQLMALGVSRPFNPSILALVERNWKPTDELAPVDDSWTSYVRTEVDREDRGEDDVRFRNGPFSYGIRVPARTATAARLWFAIASPDPGYVIDASINGHRLVLLPDHATPAAAELRLTAVREPESIQGQATWFGDQMSILGPRGALRERRYVGREIPPGWIHSGKNRLTINEYDLPGARLSKLDPPCIWNKVLSVRWAADALHEKFSEN